MFKQIIIISATLFLAASGCKTTDPDKPPELKGLPRAQAFFDQGNYQEAMIECVDIARKAPDTPGLPDLENKIVKRITEERARVAAMRAANTYDQMSTEVESNRSLPDTYGLRRGIRGNTAPLRTPPTPMELAMQKKVSLRLSGAKGDGSGFTIYDFAEEIRTSDGINMIIDPSCTNSLSMNPMPGMDIKDVPLQELLDYLDKSLNVAFYVGENVVWVTLKEKGQVGVPPPLVTRMYRLRKGISGDELDDSRSNKTAKATEPSAAINIVKAIETFVPKLAGAEIMFDKKTHVLIVKNTRENLEKAEDIIENLDVCPPQIAIESRFITTDITNLRELGVDWLLNSALTVTKENVLNNGVAVSTPQTQIASGSAIGFSPFTSGNGLNMTYQGLLTEPMFQATLHALETSGKSRTLSVPKVTTVNNKPAVIRIGQDYRYFENYDVKEVGEINTTVSGTLVQTPVYDLMPSGSPTIQKLGIELDVTPSVGADMNSINLKISPNITEKAPESDWFTYSMPMVVPSNNTYVTIMNTVTIPSFTVSEIETELILQSGETVVMGGLINSIESKGVEEIPILSSLPLIGRLFKHDTVSEDKQNLLIFVTATILSDRGENLIPISEEPKKQAEPAEKATGN